MKDLAYEENREIKDTTIIVSHLPYLNKSEKSEAAAS